MGICRRKSRVIKVGNVPMGGLNPVVIQSMTKTKTSDIKKTVRQIKELEGQGCEVIRVAVKDDRDSRAIKEIKEEVNLPIVADIHFNWKLALAAIESGVDKIRLNPGNIHRKEEIKQVIDACKAAKIPLRIGVNSGSVKNVNSGKLNMSDQLVKAALSYIRLIEKMKFYDIAVSLKASNVLDTVEAYQKMAGLCDYPMHLGITATGLSSRGVIKSSIAIGALLMQGIGDTIRVSLTENPKQEVIAAKSILEALNLRRFGPEIISCPTCGRCEVDLVSLVKKLENKLLTSEYRPKLRLIKLAVMGCVVNGPGEAREADIGIAFGKNEGLLFKAGKAIRKVAISNSINSLLKEMERPHA